MKKLVLWLLLPLLVLSGCVQQTPASEPVQPYFFYYRTAVTGFEDGEGVLAPETRDFQDKVVDAQMLLSEYLKGAEEASLVTPFPKDVQLLSVKQSGNELVIRLSSSYGTLTGVNATIADACIAKTALQLPNVRRVRILSEGEDSTTLHDAVLTRESIVLFDDSSAADTMDITLFFADSASRYLVAERRTIAYMDESRLPQYIMEQLMAGPQTKGLFGTIPAGTTLLDISIENRVCSVDLTADFLSNKPETELAERVTLLSVVNSLTQLEGIDTVQFYVEGQLQQKYLCMDISGGYTADTGAIGPVRPDLNEIDTTLYLPSAGDIALHAVPARVRQTSYESREEAVLRELLNRSGGNGLVNVLPQGLRVRSVTVSAEDCAIDLSTEFLQLADENTERAAVRSIVATMTALEGIRTVSISIDGELNAFQFLHVTGSLSPQNNWYVEAP